MTDDTDLVVEVVEALADAERVPPEELEYALSEYVDPAVLVKLADMDGDWEFSFTVADHEVTIESGGRLFVDGVLCRGDVQMRES